MDAYTTELVSRLRADQHRLILDLERLAAEVAWVFEDFEGDKSHRGMGWI